MGSSEGFNSGSVMVREVRQRAEGECSSGGQNAPASWSKIPDSELGMEMCQPSSAHSEDASNDRGLRSMSSRSLTLDLDAKHVLHKSGKKVRNIDGCTKRSGMVQMEVSKVQLGLHDVNDISSDFSSPPASFNNSEKNQQAKQKNNSTFRRGDQKNSKVKQKNRSDPFSLKGGLVGFSSASGGNNFVGINGLKPDVFDISKYIDDLSLDELLHGTCKHPRNGGDKGKKHANSNNDLLHSVKKACSVLQAQKFVPTQNCSEIDGSCSWNVSAGLMTSSSAVGQTDSHRGDSCAADLSLPNKVQGSGNKVKTFNIADLPIFQPKDILERLALPPGKDLDSLLSDASKTTSSSKNSMDPRLGKPNSHRTGLPPFPWSHSVSGHSKLGSDAVKLSTNRTMCHGRWVKVDNSTILQKISADLLVDFESLRFDQTLVPSVNLTSQHQENHISSSKCVSSASGACLTSKVPAVTPDEHSHTHAAAQTLLDMATCSSKKNPRATIKLLKKPSQKTMKASNLKAFKRSDKHFVAPKSTLKPVNPLRVSNDGYPSKKLRLPTVAINENTGLKRAK